VLLAYAASALVIPTLANVAVTDDWVYYRTVETLLVEHRLHIHDMSSAALVFQVLWGAVFAAPFGLTFGVLRISTLVMVGLGGLALYALARDLGVSAHWSAVGLAAYLFHPLVLSLAYTFMTDPHYVSLMLIATWLYVRGLRTARRQRSYLIAGSVVAACAVLVRQQAVLVPAGVVLALLLGRQLSPPRRGFSLLVQVCAVPALTSVAFSAWLRYVDGTPWALRLFWKDIMVAGWSGVAGLMPRLAVIESVYLGFFVLPIALAMLPRLPWLGRGLARWTGGVVLAWTGLVVVGTSVYWLKGMTMPYVWQFVTTTGIGPEDLIAARPELLDLPIRVGLTIACGLTSILLGLALAQRIRLVHGFFASGPGILAGVAAGQVAGAVPASIHFIGWGGTLDRYLLPLLPCALLLLLWAVRIARAARPLAWLGVLAMAIFAIGGTRDHLVFLDSVWSLAREANQTGIPNTRLDAGAGWDGFQLYERPPGSDNESLTPNPPWWAQQYAPATDSSYIVAGAAVPGYYVVLERSYWSWLHRRALPLYLLRRPDVAGPP